MVIQSSYSIAQDVFEPYKKAWLEKAESYKPKLSYSEKKPIDLVKVVEDLSGYQGLKIIKVGDMADYYNSTLKKNSSVIIDFGEHLVGYLQFALIPLSAADAPVRLKFTFGEVPSEVFRPFDPYEGTLSRAWLQDEIVKFSVLPDTIRLPNRYSFRYVKIELISSSNNYDLKIQDIKCMSTSSATTDNYMMEKAFPPPYKEIDMIAIKTLRDCMQTVFEDGPKRDKRLWIGDFKLEALANYYSFRNVELVKRCLYALASMSDSSGLLYGTIFERPFLHPEKHYPIDYCLLYNTVLTDYYHETSDLATITDLWPVAKQQILHILPFISKEGIFHLPAQWWAFIDWNDKLDKQTALQGIMIYCLNHTLELAKILNKVDEVAFLPDLIKQMKSASRKAFYDKKLKLFTSGHSHQLSTASQVWMILSETASPKEGKELFRELEKQKNVVKPGTPYMYHYVLETMVSCGMFDEAKNLIAFYWGGMIKKGADTFWEVYVPENDFVSPYHSYIINSYCHAWSCTPNYFLRKYGKEFFK
jgi:hypothetical protein